MTAVPSPVSTALDRSLLVPPGMAVKSAWISTDQIVFACKDRMSVGDVKIAYERLLQLGDNAAWPPPNGHWDDDRFVVMDGRHECVASLMLGREQVLVAWLVPAI